MMVRRNLIVGLSDSHILARQGLMVLVWKGWLQTWRSLDLKIVISWLALIGSSVGMMLVTNWTSLIWASIIWGILIGQVCPRRFSSDLGLWSAFGQLPFSDRQMLLADIASSVFGATVLCWLAYGVCSLIGWHTNLSVAILAPGIILCLTLTAVYDILRQCRMDELLAGHAPHMGSVGLYLGLILAGIPLALVLWFSGWTNAGIITWLTSLIGLFLSLGIAYLMWRLAAYQFRKIK